MLFEEARVLQDERLLRFDVGAWVKSLPDFEAEPTDDARFLSGETLNDERLDGHILVPIYPRSPSPDTYELDELEDANLNLGGADETELCHDGKEETASHRNCGYINPNASEQDEAITEEMAQEQPEDKEEQGAEQNEEEA